MTRARLLCCALLLVGLSHCGDETPPPNPAAFDRPNRVAFACFQVSGRGDPKPLPIRLCAGSAVDDPSRPDIALHALVTQTTRGEVAAVDLEARRVLDARRDIPGPTFLPAGELPAAIVVPPNHPTFTYVANAGSRDISVLRTRAFRELTPGESATVQSVKLTLPGGDGVAASPSDMVIAPDEDALFVVSADQGSLLRVPLVRCPAADAVSGDDAGAAAGGGASCVDGLIDEAGITRIDLAPSAAAAVVPPAQPSMEDPYRFVCTDTPLLPVPAAVPTELPATTAQAEPVAMAVDAFCRAGQPCTRRLLIADRALPFIHVVDLDAAAAGGAPVRAPLVTGTPTDAVTVSPHVPVFVDASSEDDTQYVYAIDHSDGSVIVLQDGQVLTLSSDPVSRPNRLALGTSFALGAPVALSLAILTPEFDVTGPSSQYAVKANVRGEPVRPLCTDAAHPTFDPRRLRGVFLAVGLSDGTVRIADIHDMELAECRTCSPKPAFPVIRHRTRIASVLAAGADELPSLSPNVKPYFAVEGSVVVVQSDGTTNDPRVTGLDCVACTDPLAASFPDPDGVSVIVDAGAPPDSDDGGEPLDASADGGIDGGVDAGPPPMPACLEGQALACGIADPWAAAQGWEATYEGAIPSANGGQGRFAEPVDDVRGTVTFSSEITFCDKGVLGDDDLGGQGDQLVITSELPSGDVLEDAELRSDCELLVRARAAGTNRISFRIRRAFEDHLLIDQRLIDAPTGLSASQRDFRFVQNCFAGMLMSFEVRTRDSFRVLGSRSGFLNRVETSSSGRCRNDDTRSPQLTGRARDGEPFDNGFIAFQIARREDDQTGQRIRPSRGTTLLLDFSAATGKVVLNAASVGFGVVSGVLPVDLDFSPSDQRLYVVDMTARGLIPVAVNPFPAQASFSYE